VSIILGHASKNYSKIYNHIKVYIKLHSVHFLLYNKFYYYNSPRLGMVTSKNPWLYKEWCIDPSPEKISDGNKPLVRLQWDPSEFMWTDPFKSLEGPLTPFFKYIVKLGRRILAASQKQVTLVSVAFWRQQSISNNFLNQFWINLWSRNLPRKLILFQWLITNRATTVCCVRPSGGTESIALWCLYLE
jgi:hypothetical protein